MRAKSKPSPTKLPETLYVDQNGTRKCPYYFAHALPGEALSEEFPTKRLAVYRYAGEVTVERHVVVKEER